MEIVVEGATLRGWLRRPDAAGPHPLVVLTHGWAAVKELFLEEWSDALVSAGVACLVYDHRNFGASDGEPRQEIDPARQVADTRAAIEHARSLPDVDPDRIGLWGTSYSGGHALTIGATDHRLGAVVALVPTISGSRNTRRRFPGDALDELRVAFEADRRTRAAGGAPALVEVAEGLTEAAIAGDGDDVTGPIGNDGPAFFTSAAGARLAGWRNAVTLRSLELYDGYEPGATIERIAPTPLLVVAMSGDTVTPIDDLRAAYARAGEPKQLVELPGGHFDVYGIHRATVAGLAAAFLSQHLAAAVAPGG
jgi:fermentation-respiration switch protein FrsA (DUF1100 family)